MTSQIKNIENFVSSDHNSSTEKAFLDKDLQAYYKQKLGNKYRQILENEHGVSPSETAAAQTDNVKGTKSSRLIILGVSLIALIIASFFAYNTLTSNKEEVKSQYAFADLGYIEMEGSSRGLQSDQEIAVAQIQAAYANKEFAEVITQYNKLSEENITQDIRLQTAIAFANTDQYEQSVALYTGLLNSVTTKGLLQEIQWSAFNTYMLYDQKDKALDLFQQMGPSHERYTLAKEILGN